MREIEDLLPHVMPYAPGCAEPTAIQHLRDAAVRFCERTRCWRHIDRFKTDTHHHQIMAVPSQAVLYEIEWAKFGERHELEARTPDVEDWHREGDEAYSYPRYISQVNPTCVSIEPHVVGDLSISMFLKPSPTTDMLPDFLVSHFGRAMGDGALATLLLLPNQPFTNPQMAAIFEGKFQAAMDKNFDFNLRGQQRARKRTRPNFL